MDFDRLMLPVLPSSVQMFYSLSNYVIDLKNPLSILFHSPKCLYKGGVKNNHLQVQILHLLVIYIYPLHTSKMNLRYLHILLLERRKQQQQIQYHQSYKIDKLGNYSHSNKKPPNFSLQDAVVQGHPDSNSYNQVDW